VLFSVNQKTRGHYAMLFRERKVRKVYEALAPTPVAMSDFPATRRSRIVRGEPFFRMQEVAGEPNAETCIDAPKRADSDKLDGAVSLYQLRPITGKKHQLRVHLAALGVPIINDRLYPHYVREHDREDDFLRPLKLLARSIEFRDPVTGNECYFESKQEL
jgi:tRNA pseudouridine32 synthase / 23S rRNA pseudouridine746 synthase